MPNQRVQRIRHALRLTLAVSPCSDAHRALRRVDSSEPDEFGMCDYYYKYDIYRFTDEPMCFIACSYIDEPDEAHFLGIDVA